MLLLQGLQAAAKSPQFACWMLMQGLLYAHCLLAPEAAPIQAVCSPVASGHVPGGRDHPLSSRAWHSLRRKRLSRTCTCIWQTRWGPAVHTHSFLSAQHHSQAYAFVYHIEWGLQCTSTALLQGLVQRAAASHSYSLAPCLNLRCGVPAQQT